MAGTWRRLRNSVQRKKQYELDQLEVTNLRRCLNRWDLTALGLGSTLGVGVYVLIGFVALKIAGPSIVLSFLIAAVASMFAGLCYAEFGSRVPRAGSAYTYTYVSVGELMAFIVGWNNILEALFGAASVARGLSMYIDSMSNRTMSEWFESFAPISVLHMSPYFDFFAFLLVIMIGVLLAFGVRESSSVNNVFATVNMAVILFVVLVGAFAADASNWKIPASEVPDNYGLGGFFPYGVWGTLRGAAVCFYGFVGFDSISASAEEVREPRRAIPLTIITVLIIVFVSYASVATVVTMMVPYYLQDTVASVATAFSFVGWEWARWIVSIGAVFGILSSLFGAMFPLPRLLYTMSSDGFLFGWFAKLTTNRQSPALATLLSTSVTATLAGLLELEQLILMMCFGTLLSYTIMAAGIILLRYRSDYTPGESSGFIKRNFGCGVKVPSQTTSRIIGIALVIFMCLCLTIALVLIHAEYPLIPNSILHVLALIMLIVIALQPKSKEKLTFKTPLVPLIPCLSIYVNTHLMVLINVQTWIRVAIWIMMGIPIYVICVCCCNPSKNNLKDNLNTIQENGNGKPPVQIIVESPTPPNTIIRISNGGGENNTPSDTEIEQETQRKVVRNDIPYVTEDIIVHQSYVENNEEKEAKIIDLLDQVLQAEEDTYGEVISLKEQKEEGIVSTAHETETHRKSLGELSDAGSDASIGNQVLSKYDVIALVHREDLPKVNEEEERNEKEEDIIEEIENYEQVTAFNNSETNSQTDESGYSDTIDKNTIGETMEENKEEIPYIPVPPPLDENYFRNSNFKKSYTIGSKHIKRPSPEKEEEEGNKHREGINSIDSQDEDDLTFNSDIRDVPYIPVPPPLDENYFGNSNFKKSYTIASKHTRKPTQEKEEEEENKPRESVTSNNSQSDGNIIFGSDRTINFMSKLNNIFQTKITSNNEEEEPRKRSLSTGNVVENTELSIIRERPQMFLDLQKEIKSKEAAQNLRPVNIEDKKPELDDAEEQEDTSMSRDDLKSKLENIFAAGGPQLLKPRLMKSNPPTPEDSYQTDTSSTESIAKLPKVEKNDTLKRQKAKFSEVLNSFRLSFNKDDVV